MATLLSEHTGLVHRTCIPHIISTSYVIPRLNTKHYLSLLPSSLHCFSIISYNHYLCAIEQQHSSFVVLIEMHMHSQNKCVRNQHIFCAVMVSTNVLLTRSNYLGEKLLRINTNRVVLIQTYRCVKNSTNCVIFTTSVLRVYYI